jgi:hypothetical protein
MNICQNSLKYVHKNDFTECKLYLNKPDLNNKFIHHLLCKPVQEKLVGLPLGFYHTSSVLNNYTYYSEHYFMCIPK